MVGPKGEFIDTMNGRTINPGHCIETSWFLFDVARNIVVTRSSSTWH